MTLSSHSYLQQWQREDGPWKRKTEKISEEDQTIEELDKRRKELRLKTLDISVSNGKLVTRYGNIKCPIGGKTNKDNFAVNLPLKLFRATITNADTASP